MRSTLSLLAVLVCFASVTSVSAQDVPAEQPAPVVAPPPPPPPPPPAAEGQKRNGFVLEVHFGTQLVSLGGGAAATFGALEGGVFAGVKLGKLILAAGLSFSRVHTAGGGVAPDTSSTPVVFMSGIRYSFVRSSDQRVELFGELDLGIGHSFTEPGDTNNIIFRYVVGPGVRYWVHPQFAVAALTGIEGTFVWNNDPWRMTDQHGVFATLQLMGVF